MQKLDVTDRCLIALLQADGRLPHTELARQLGIPEATVRRRMKRLLDERIVQIVAVPDPYKIGYDTHAIVGLRVQPGKIAAVTEVLSPLPEVRYLGVTAGTYDIVVEALFESNDDLRRFLTDTLGDIDGIQGAETSYVLKVMKRTYSVGAVLDGVRGYEGEEETTLMSRREAALAEITVTGAAGASRTEHDHPAR